MLAKRPTHYILRDFIERVSYLITTFIITWILKAKFLVLKTILSEGICEVGEYVPVLLIK